MEFPLLDRDIKAVAMGVGAQHAATDAGDKEGRQAGSPETSGSGLGEPSTFLLELGVEELPPKDMRAAIRQMEERFPALLDELRLENSAVKVAGTPRRIVVHVRDLAPRQADVEDLIKGPPAERAFDEHGDPTSAGLGFARSKGIPVDDLRVEEIDGGRYAVAHVFRAGKPAADVLEEAIPELLASIQFDKTMRWNHTNIDFSRPIRWIVALFGEVALSFEYAGVRSGDRTHGMRMLEPPEIPVASPEDYFAKIEAQGIILDPAGRAERILAGLVQLAEDAEGRVAEDPDLLAAVTGEVEAPTAVRGAFDREFLKLPPEVLVAVMKKHQNYFPVEAADGRLLAYFLAVVNGDTQDRRLVAAGNEDVIRARFEDAAFFIDKDRKRSLADFVSDLDSLMFQEDLGSMGDKTARIRALVDALASGAGLNTEEKDAALRAAALCKADLATSMVVEMTSLQGVMGRYYALGAGEPEAVAWAIEEHYRPRFSGDAAPASRAGLMVGMADRLDSLAGLFAVGLAPTGAKDPFALRRAALGLVSNLIHWDQDFDVGRALKIAADGLPVEAEEESVQAAMAFVVGRLRNLLLDEGRRYDVVEAVLEAQGHNPAGAARAVISLEAWVDRDDWSNILPAYSRCVRITRDLDETYTVDSELFQEPAERALYAALEQAEAAPGSGGSVDDFLKAFEPLIPAVNQFFDDVLVMAEDEEVKRNRLGLLQRIAALADGVADMSRLEGF
ncbi:MAG: glycine--tRNA ligase subunit beta [Anaerolineales bacterium]|nr:glycine--tRNA ligase subunit beta [Anaerolineales bacterium]